MRMSTFFDHAFSGKTLAELELRLTVVNLVRHFKFSTSKTLDQLEVLVSYITRLEAGYKVKIERRH